MLLCCLRRNVQASCHKHFVVVSREKQTTPLTSEQLTMVCRSWMYCTCRSKSSQHVMEPAIGSESRFLPTPPAFDAPVRRPRQTIAIMFGTQKLEWCGYPLVEKFRRYVYSLWENSRTCRTDRGSEEHRTTAYRPRMHSITQQKSRLSTNIWPITTAGSKVPSTVGRSTVMARMRPIVWTDDSWYTKAARPRISGDIIDHTCCCNATQKCNIFWLPL